MRIGDVTTDNYMGFMKMFGGKGTRLPGAFGGKGAKSQADAGARDHEAKLISAGYLEEGMLLRAGDDSWKRRVPVSDEIKETLISVVQRQFVTNGNGMGTTEDGDEIGALMKEYRKNIPPGERLSVTWTMEQIVREESNRLVNFVKANDPEWSCGREINQDLLSKAVSSGGIDIQA